MELLIGCGNKREKRLHLGRPAWSRLLTLDIDPACKPDCVHDLEAIPYPFEADTFDEVHAYDVLEHTGRQGDWRFFFAQWSEFHRIMRPGGMLFASVPTRDSVWAWGDPGHSRIISPQSLVFLDQRSYSQQVGATAMTDYRGVYSADFELLTSRVDEGSFSFCLRAVKPSRMEQIHGQES